MNKTLDVINKILNILIVITFVLMIVAIIVGVNNLIFGFLGIPAIEFIANIVIGFLIGSSDWFNKFVSNVLDS